MPGCLSIFSTYKTQSPGVKIRGAHKRPLIRHDRLSGIAATRQVVDRAGKFKTKWSGHGAGV